MWVRLWMTFSVSATVLSQQANTRVHQAGAGFEWGWVTPGAGQGGVGQYYVKLPQSEQRVLYRADSSGYHGAVRVNTSDPGHTHSAAFALGQKAIDLETQQENSAQNRPNPAAEDSRGNLFDIFLLQQQYSQVPNQQYVQLLTNGQNINYNNLTPLYNIQTQHPARNERNESSKPLEKEAKSEQTFITPVQIFKDHNCTDKDEVSKEIQRDLKKSQDLFAEVSSYSWQNINGNFGAKTKQPLYRGEANYRVETPRQIDRSERVYYTSEPIYSPEYNATQEGINRLVASTQDLISNEDLLQINNAIEQHLREHGEDLIKPNKYSTKNSQESLETSPTMITVQAKISNILKGQIEQTGKDSASEEVLHADSNAYKFSTPIVVADGPNKNLGSQLLDNVVTTVVPYLGKGYEIVGINSDGNKYNNEDSEENLVNVTPRPIGISYLAPLTVALRLLNSNENETHYQDDHEGADSELVTDTVAKPNKQKTVVEIQESIPLEVTHINEVEVHEYLDEGRANNQEAYDIAKTLYDKLSSSLQLKDNLNKILNKYSDMANEENTNNDKNQNRYGDSKEQLETSENIQSQVQVSPNSDANNQRSEAYNYYGDTNENRYESDSQKIIQPIIIEKQVPVTKFVNRYIEKQVPYPEAVAVPIPVDRPVPYAVPYEKVVEKPVHVTKYVDKPYPVEVPRPYPVEIQVPYPVPQKVYVDRPIHIAYPVEKIIEKPVVHPVAVPTPYGVPIEVPYPVEQKILYPFPVDRPVPIPVEVEKPVEKVIHKEVPVPYPVERRVPYPVPYETKVPVPIPVEKKVQIPVEKIVEKPVPQIIEKPVPIQVPVPHPVPVHVHHPYPVEKIVEKKVPYPVPVDRIVERKIPVKVPYPVEKIVEKIVEKPVVVTKYVDKPYPVEKLVPYPVEVKMPYQAENHNNDLRVSYRYRPMEEETRNHPQYQPLDQNELKKRQFQNLKAQYDQYVREFQKEKRSQQLKSQYEQYVKDFQKVKAKPQLLESTHWGNHYASSYQYINNTTDHPRDANIQRNQEMQNYANHIANLQNQNAQRQFYGVEQNQYAQNQNDNYAGASQNQNNWDKNKNYLVEVKVRRTDRVPKVTIEYGGFKPPLIPSTEVDLDGLPINKSE